MNMARCCSLVQIVCGALVTSHDIGVAADRFAVGEIGNGIVAEEHQGFPVAIGDDRKTLTASRKKNGQQQRL